VCSGCVCARLLLVVVVGVRVAEAWCAVGVDGWKWRGGGRGRESGVSSETGQCLSVCMLVCGCGGEGSHTPGQGKEGWSPQAPTEGGGRRNIGGGFATTRPARKSQHPLTHRRMHAHIQTKARPVHKRKRVRLKGSEYKRTGQYERGALKAMQEMGSIEHRQGTLTPLQTNHTEHTQHAGQQQEEHVPRPQRGNVTSGPIIPKSRRGVVLVVGERDNINTTILWKLGMQRGGRSHRHVP
jgi:hypothetical protein